MTLPHVTAGFLPLLDSALLVLAHEMGFAEEEGFTLGLTRETSWANIRDRTALGHFDISLVLAPMPIAASLGLTPISTPMIVPIMTGLGNNAITVSAALWKSMADAGAPGDLQAGPAGQALAKVVKSNARKLRFGVVHQTSSHNYELRYWLAASGIRPDVDIEIVVLPPPLLPEALGAGSLDGYCVGEPWNSVGVSRHGARIATTKASIWQWSPDKAIGMRSDWAERNPDLVERIVRAVYKAGQWCQVGENRLHAASIMAAPAYLDLPIDIVERALTGRIDTGTRVIDVTDYFIPHDGVATFPWKSHALWYYSQMVRWNEATTSDVNAKLAAGTFRPDLYRAALAPLGVPTPSDDYRRDGDQPAPHLIAATNGELTAGPNRFFDGTVFDPDHLDAYIAAQRS
ncbi:NitT/TauT family transport system ATP-binding protein [Devosia lucknowensis]|uniref:NitT/TauT family transport system ATP-binding protein n=1 Tax=Devosia lucknowensis TaxID=1096929 RepID=A0A1Y6EHZ7_9HYPH|nr:CmpA/NrtA family ABC transporter substrate-binding protein [Devosia lucknowensis]SMQ60801.1 NitT/TauT family transport system ATP-binding protein [Devosia lucknowensis]